MLPRIATHDEWLVARKTLLAAEKAMTKDRDELNTRRRELPMVEITKDYVLRTRDTSYAMVSPAGPRSIGELWHLEPGVAAEQ